MNKPKNIPRLIAHRGYARLFPENTLPALEAAMKCGAWDVEFDVQVSKDLVPVLMHDQDLRRATGVEGQVMDMTAAELESLSAHEPERFGEKFKHVKIPTLAQAASLFEKWPAAFPFVEMKRESMMVHGHERVVKAVMRAIGPILDRSVVLSFDWEGVRLAREEGAIKIGWVVKTWNEESRLKAMELAPDFLICNYEKLPPPPGELWQGPWQWVLYEITDPELAINLAARGADFIVTMNIGEMASHSLFQWEGPRGG